MITLALTKNLDLIAVCVPKPNGDRVTRFVPYVYSKPAGTETTVKFEKWEEGKKKWQG